MTSLCLSLVAAFFFWQIRLFTRVRKKMGDKNRKKKTQKVLFDNNSKEFIYKILPEGILFTKLHIFPICGHYDITNSWRPVRKFEL